MKNKITLLLFAITMSIGCRTTDKNIDSTLFYEDCQSTIDSIYSANPKSVGIMIHIESPINNLSWSSSIGYSNKDQKTKLSSDQPALIASCIKTYVSASILRLQELNLLSIEDSISKHLTAETIRLFEDDGYDFNKIKIKHLLSHTSGIKDYADTEYIEWIDNNKKHRWTREEQLKLTVKKGDPLGDPEDIWSYADANFLLCTEIIESNTKKPFYTSMRNLLEYEELGLRDTWFPTLEKPSTTTKPMVHQYWGLKNWDSHNHDISWDLYGGGGIATTTEELAKFYYNLFQGNIIEDTITLNKIFTKITPSNNEDTKYYLGLGEGSSNGLTYYTHGGFWGTTVLYIPKLETSIAVYILEKDKSDLKEEAIYLVINQLKKHLKRN